MCAETHIGKVRDNNEDNFYCAGTYKKKLDQNNFQYSCKKSFDDFLVLGVFDGMGGMQSGEKASYITSVVLDRYIKLIRGKRISFDGIYIIREINRQICSAAKRHSNDMGSTVVLLTYEKGTVRCYNLGDSRAYMYRKGKLLQLSVDHTAENHMKEIRKSLGISEDKRPLAGKNILTQHLGIEEEEFLLEPAMSEEVQIQKHDIYLLCSDGLTNMVSDERISDILSRAATLEEKRCYLVNEALKNGGKDNITVVLVEIVQEAVR